METNKSTQQESFFNIFVLKLFQRRLSVFKCVLIITADQNSINVINMKSAVGASKKCLQNRKAENATW